MDTTQTNMSEPQPGPSVTGAQALIESFLREGVDTIFGYPGGAIIPVYDALYDYRDRLRHILVRHEQGAVHAAQGYARVSGRVGVCLVTSGPGATNTVTGLADALMDSTPLVLVTGQVGSSLLGTDAFQETNFVGITQAVTKWNCQVKRTEEIPGAIAKAFYIARSGRPGPVVVDITKDAQCGTAPFSYEKVASIRSYVPASVPSEERIDEAARLIDAAKRSCAPSSTRAACPPHRPCWGFRPCRPTRRSTSACWACTATTVPTSKTGTATCSSPWACASTTA